MLERAEVRSARAAVLLLLVGATLLGCTAAPAQPPARDPLRELLQNVDAAHGADTAGRDARIAALRQRLAAATPPALDLRIELGLALARPGATDTDYDDAAAVFAPCAEAPPAEQARQPLLSSCRVALALIERDRARRAAFAELRASSDALAQRIAIVEAERDGAVAAAATRQEADAKRIASLERRIAEQERRLRSLRRQMRELQAIESSIEDRHEDGARE